LLANARVLDMTEAIEQFERSVKLDPAFAGAYVSLAEAEVFLGEFEVSDDPQRFERALRRGHELVEKALLGKRLRWTRGAGVCDAVAPRRGNRAA
jgi:hypothetical protein